MPESVLKLDVTGLDQNTMTKTVPANFYLPKEGKSSWPKGSGALSASFEAPTNTHKRSPAAPVAIEITPQPQQRLKIRKEPPMPPTPNKDVPAPASMRLPMRVSDSV